ncbi:MAG: hypothetical protein DWQ10_05025 [Calditrichaeota bacterium]|nr:MAG: hypothetical protein DWQ10_05025 [Calditrichota bacterium]
MTNEIRIKKIDFFFILGLDLKLAVRFDLLNEFMEYTKFFPAQQHYFRGWDYEHKQLNFADWTIGEDAPINLQKVINLSR